MWLTNAVKKLVPDQSNPKKAMILAKLRELRKSTTGPRLSRTKSIEIGEIYSKFSRTIFSISTLSTPSSIKLLMVSTDKINGNQEKREEVK